LCAAPSAEFTRYTGGFGAHLHARETGHEWNLRSKKPETLRATDVLVAAIPPICGVSMANPSGYPITARLSGDNPPTMPPFAPIALLSAAVLLTGGLIAIRVSGAHPGIARRLAGAHQVRVGDLLTGGELPIRPVRVAGRIRCPDPIVTGRDERLVALHRDVQVKPPGGAWRSIERIRESRGFELWDHDGSIPLDPADAAEPLIVLPHVWRGTTAELDDASHRAAVARLGAAAEEVWPARSVTRMVSVVERLLVLASVQPAAGGPNEPGSPDQKVRLSPPPGGYLISGLELDDAMRLLGGRRRELLLVGYGLLLAALLAGGIGAVGLLIGS
jgi:hypothetical protein